MFDGRIDEEMIGAPYWFVELYLLARERGVELGNRIEASERLTYERWRDAMEKQHQKNAHKYRVGSPAIHRS